MISLKTERLLICDHKPEDLEHMHPLMSDPVAMYYLEDIWTYDIEDTRRNLEAAISEATSEKRVKYFFSMIEIKSNRYMGEIGFTTRLDTPEGKVVNLGYFILPEFWGRGFTTEAASEVIRYAFEEAGVVKIETGCIKDNAASEKVMQKLGMIKEAEFRNYVWHDNRLKDRVEYRLLKDEWLKTGS